MFTVGSLDNVDYSQVLNLFFRSNRTDLSGIAACNNLEWLVLIVAYRMIYPQFTENTLFTESSICVCVFFYAKFIH